MNIFICKIQLFVIYLDIEEGGGGGGGGGIYN
jgi:hypothetical protein